MSDFENLDHEVGIDFLSEVCQQFFVIFGVSSTSKKTNSILTIS